MELVGCDRGGVGLGAIPDERVAEDIFVIRFEDEEGVHTCNGNDCGDDEVSEQPYRPPVTQLEIETSILELDERAEEMIEELRDVEKAAAKAKNV